MNLKKPATRNPMNPSNPTILLTIDVEDWFQVENFKQYIPFSSWPSCELRVEANTHRLLDLLDSQQSAGSSQGSAASGERSVSTNTTNSSNTTNPINPSDSLRQRRTAFHHFHLESDEKKKSRKSCLPRRWAPSYWGKSCLTTPSPKATFFVLGWIAERLPHLVRKIHARGHEVASHGYHHKLCTEQSREDLKSDLTGSKKLLEDIIGSPVCGYRAPSFSINHDILKIIEECGYLYDSSYNSFSMHGRYGRVDLSMNGKKGVAAKLSDTFYELPVSNIELGKCPLPWGGGGYFRLMPLRLFEIGVKSILRKHGAYLFYMHPWEVDPEQPRVGGASPFFKFRHYVNLDKTLSKLSRLVGTFNSTSFVSCHRYLEENL